MTNEDLTQEKPAGRNLYRRYIIVFISYFLASKLDQYTLHGLHPSPAIIASPVGIALGLLLIWGLEQWIAVALAQLFVVITSGPLAATNGAMVALIVIAYTGQAVIGAYLLKRFDFNGLLLRTRDVLALCGVAFFATAIGPGLTTLGGLFDNTLRASFWITWSEPWAGGILSTLILTPLITSWFSMPLMKIWKYIKVREALAAMIVLAAITYILFWTALPGQNSFLLIYLFLAVFFWIGLRLQPRVMALALFFATAFGMIGSIVAHPTSASLSTQLFADELFMIFVAPMFLIMSVIGTERRIAVSSFQKETQGLAEAMEKLSEQDASRNEFITMLAHEIRNPLAPIASTLEYLNLNETDPKNLTAINMAQQQIHIVRRLLDDLLDVSRISHKKFMVYKETILLNAVMDPAIAAVEQFYQSKNHRLVVSLPEENIFLNGDPVRLTQAIVNLLFNAAKYTAPGGLIKLTAKREENTLLISIKDNGIGISPEILPFIFEPFKQAAQEAKVGTGLGLGLYITKQLIEAHGGTVTAASEVSNQGSEFCIRLPLPPQPQNSPVRNEDRSLHFKAPGRSLKIIVVDDNEAAAISMQKLLGMRGHQTDIAHNGKNALELINALEPEVVILDIDLPDMTGYEIAQKVRENYPAMLLIAVTGYGQPQDRLDAKNAGFDYHLTKPIELASLEKIFDLINNIDTEIPAFAETKAG